MLNYLRNGYGQFISVDQVILIRSGVLELTFGLIVKMELFTQVMKISLDECFDYTKAVHNEVSSSIFIENMDMIALT